MFVSFFRKSCYLFIIHILNRLHTFPEIVENIDEIPDNSLVIFSAHGVSSEVEETTKCRNLNYFD